MPYADIIINSTAQTLDRPFLYEAPDEMELRPGDLVQVPFGNGNRRSQGFVMAVSHAMPEDMPKDKSAQIKAVTKVLSRGLFDDKGRALIEYMRTEYLCSYLDALRLLIPKGELKGIGHKYRKILMAGTEPEAGRKNSQTYRAIYQYVQEALKEGGVIRAEAVKAGFSASAINTMLKHGYLTIEDRLDARWSVSDYHGDEEKKLNRGQIAVFAGIEQGEPGTYLLHGITGSGKTEVFLRLVGSMLKQGHDSVILVPEIALTPQMIERVKARFGRDVTVYHSRLNDGERYDEWMRVRQGQVKIAIGARSALFLPFADLKLIVIDEEHETSYKSETSPKFVTRDVADFMMRHVGGKVVLASATPSLESFWRAQKGEYHLLQLTQRAGEGFLPEIVTVDLRKELRLGNRSILSARLQSEMEESLARGRQIILFLNRRGVSGFVSCRACGFVYQCPNCSVALTKHQGSRLTCHHCGHTKFQKPLCPSCGSNLIREFGIGTEKVEEEVRRRFPFARTLRMDRDTTGHKDAYEEIYRAFRNEEADILIGTQMVAKGLDFYGVDLVGILAADLSMNLPDFRAYEKTFQLITQVSGRAGRADKGGLVILQTYQPESYPVTMAAKGDYLGFYEREIMVREALNYPPLGRLMSLVLSGRDEADLIKNIQKVALAFRDSSQGYANMTVMGPVPCLLSKIKGWYRQQLMVKGDIPQEAAVHLKELAYEAAKGKDIRVSLDTNPVNLL